MPIQISSSAAPVDENLYGWHASRCYQTLSRRIRWHWLRRASPSTRSQPTGEAQREGMLHIAILRRRERELRSGVLVWCRGCTEKGEGELEVLEEGTEKGEKEGRKGKKRYESRGKGEVGGIWWSSMSQLTSLPCFSNIISRLWRRTAFFWFSPRQLANVKVLFQLHSHCTSLFWPNMILLQPVSLITKIHSDKQADWIRQMKNYVTPVRWAPLWVMKQRKNA